MSEAPEPVVLDPCEKLERAGFLERAGAFSLDVLLVLWIYIAGLHLIVRLPLPDGILSFVKWYAAFLGAIGVSSLAYFSILNSCGRQTLGKRVFGLRVSLPDGRPVRWRKALFRSFGYVFSEGAFYLGFLWVLWDRKKEAWHDKLAGTAVLALRPTAPRTRGLALLAIACLILSSLLPSSAVRQRFQAYTTPTASMVLTLLPGDYFIADLQFLKHRALAHGDVIVFEPPLVEGDQAYIKRCVALENEEVRVRRNLLLLNEEAVSEPYVFLGGLESPYANFGPLRVPTDSVFVMGDNRDNSLDSRYFGPLARNHILGHADLIYWSMDPDLKLPRVERMGKRIR